MKNKLPVKQLLEWYNAGKRDLPWRHTSDIYAVWISEVMLQQTQVSTVIPYYLRFLERFPNVADLAAASEQDVLKLWEGLGYYSRGRNLHKAAKKVIDDFNGEIPGTLETFSTLPGVGPYIASAVLSIARGIPLAAVDGNVMRVYTRFKAIEDDIRKNATRTMITKELQEIIPKKSAGDFTQAFMELGALVCTPKKPKCSECPFQAQCTALQTNTIDRCPVKSPLKKAPEYDVAIAVIVDDNKIFIQKRPSEGHLGGLWEFPGGKAKKGETPEQTVIRECREELNAQIEINKKLTVIHHAYSHFKIHMHVFICRLKQNAQQITVPANIPCRWITIDEIEDYPFPGANRKFFGLLRGIFTEFC